MDFGFLNTHPILNESWDFRHFTLKESLIYKAKNGRVYRAPEGTKTDLLSVPPEFWVTIAPFGIKKDDTEFIGGKAGILHDTCYQNSIQVQTPEGNWILLNPTREDSDLIIKESLQSEGVPESKVEEIYLALCAFGGRAFREDRNI